MVIHDEDSQEAVRVFDARVGHFDEDIGVLLEIYHQFLLLLHEAESVFVHAVSVVEKQVIFTCKFNLDLLDLVLARSILYYSVEDTRG